MALSAGKTSTVPAARKFHQTGSSDGPVGGQNQRRARREEIPSNR